MNNLLILNKYSWLVLTLMIFLVLTYIRGSDGRGYNDYYSDITTLRVIDGAPLAAIVSDRSPVSGISFPYGSWPPIHTFMQGSISLLNVDVSTARLLTNFIIYAIGIWYLFKLCDRNSLDFTTSLIVLLISPVSVFFVWHGQTHVIIFSAILAGIYYAQVACFEEGINYIKLIMIGFILGLTDWFVYPLVPAVALFFLYRHFSTDKSSQTAFGKVIRLLLGYSIGFIFAFVLVKFAQVYALSQESVLHAPMGLGFDKLHIRMVPDAEKVLFAITYTAIRWVLLFVPVYLLLRLVKGKREKTNNEQQQFILFVALSIPLLFALIFTGQVAVSDHKMQMMSFFPFIALYAGLYKWNSLRENKAKMIILIGLIIYTLYGISGYKIVPSWMLARQWETEYVEYPPPPGEYDITSHRSPLTTKNIIRTVNNQILTYPGTSKRIVGLKTFNKYWSEIELYGDKITGATRKDDVIVVYGHIPPGFSYFTKRAVMGFSSNEKLASYFIDNVFSNRYLVLVNKSVKVEELEDSVASLVKWELNVRETPYKLLGIVNDYN